MAIDKQVQPVASPIPIDIDGPIEIELEPSMENGEMGADIVDLQQPPQFSICIALLPYKPRKGYEP